MRDRRRACPEIIPCRKISTLEGSVCKEQVECLSRLTSSRVAFIEKFTSQRRPKISEDNAIPNYPPIRPSAGLSSLLGGSEPKQPSLKPQRNGLLSASELYGKVKDKVLLIVTGSSKNEDDIRQGSAVAVGGGWLATNCHVLEGQDVLLTTRQGTNYQASGFSQYKEIDLCFVFSPELRMQGVQLAKEVPEIGERVYALGNPRGLTLTLTEGIVSSHRKTSKNGPMIQTSASITNGSSGGGLFNERGELVGITTSGLAETQGLNFAIAVDSVHSKMKDLREQARLELGYMGDIFSESLPIASN